MYHDPAPEEFVDLFNTPVGRARNDIIYAQHRAAIKDRILRPSQVSAAAAEFRQTRFIDSGLEHLTGSASTYHLQTLADTICQAADQLNPDCLDHSGSPKKCRPRRVLRFLAKLHGYRYLVGVRGVTDALREACVGALALGRFMLERDAFHEEFLEQLDGAYIVNERGECPQAVVNCVIMMIEELHQLCDWVDLTGQRSTCQVIRASLTEARLIIQANAAEDRAKPRRRKTSR